ncbi:hypothetical protein VTK56DRAFT_6717 [Thermocarpiscus australiensis]
MSSPKTILFLGATGGVALSALRRSLKANHTCIALCRTPSNLASKFPSDAPLPPNLHIEQGNAHDVDALMRCLLRLDSSSSNSPPRLVDTIVTSIGSVPTLTGGLSDPHVCQTGMRALLTALRRCRAEKHAVGTPRIVAVSSTGLSRVERDVPVLMVPLYRTLLAGAHEDKIAMEKELVASGEEWTLVRGSFYTNGPETEGKIRVGLEDPVRGVVESRAIGYTISREDLGKWIFENCVQLTRGDRKWAGKAVIVTY